MIIVYPNKKLRQKCQLVERIDQEVKKTIRVLEKELLAKGNGIGLAAPQVGKNQRIFALKDCFQPNCHHQNCAVTIFINPLIEFHSAEKVYPAMVDEEGKKEEFLEGCLSLPGLWGTVKRWLKIKVSWQSPLNGKLVKRKKTISGLGAIAFQHELDHLEGILFIDRIKEEKGKLFKIERNGEKEEVDLKSVVSDLG